MTHYLRLPFCSLSLPTSAAGLYSEQQGVTDACLDCIAATTTQNKPTKCGETPCGIYGIHLPYWKDALLAVPNAAGAQDYESCVSKGECGAAIVRGYMKSYTRDCNGDGIISCRDQIMLHLLGPTGCLRRDLPAKFHARMSECLRVKELE
ncbi:hypothetical protein KR222_003950 [Zaprionus bogoriensis]|nr:hypothetical protein KR222_003950 [Zaprionus bogoriensis]